MVKRLFVVYILQLCHQIFSCDALNVIQSPKRLVLLEGESAVINCTWDPDHRAKQIRVEWRISNISSTEEENKTLLASVLWKGNDTRNVTQRNHNRSTYNLSNGKAELRINSVTVRDEGIYFCEINIEIPRLQHGRGNGTELGINKLNNTDNTGFSNWLDKYKWYLTPISAIIIPVLILVYCLYRKRKRRRECFQDHIYSNERRRPKNAKNVKNAKTAKNAKNAKNVKTGNTVKR
ncbi:transmembrane and immunoglobulin domain-containing 2-like [Pelobates cultripes]|nr:transmembrane and immunoglobulin domain-containing 2-like [Pelobates cultripes]